MTDTGISADRARLAKALAGIRPASDRWRCEAVRRLDRLTKPPGSLGRLEDLAVQLCAIQETLTPQTMPRRVVVCAADHGVTAEGVSAYPKAVTGQMVTNFLRGGAAINALAAAARADLIVLDAGVDGTLPHGGGDDSTGVPVALKCSRGEPGNAAGARLLVRRIRNGTRNMLHEPAMTDVELLRALDVGLDMADTAAADGMRLIALGEMGIGNTTAASAVTAVLTGRAAASVTGRGTGIDDEVYGRKANVVDRAIARHRCTSDAPLEALRSVGGLEIAALCGLCLGAANHRIGVVTDGFVATAAVLVATALAPSVAEYVFAAHLSPEPGHAVQLARLGLAPLLTLDMRLGEGTGASLALPMIDAAARAFTCMATFDAAGVSEHQC